MTFELRRNGKDGSNMEISDESWLSRQKERQVPTPKAGASLECLRTERPSEARGMGIRGVGSE